MICRAGSKRKEPTLSTTPVLGLAFKHDALGEQSAVRVERYWQRNVIVQQRPQEQSAQPSTF